MMQHILNINLESNLDIFGKLLNLSEQFTECCYLCSNNFKHDKYAKYEWMIALGSIDKCALNGSKTFRNTDLFLEKHSKEWKFTYLNYDLKNQIEKVNSDNLNNLGFNDLFLFVPKFLILAYNQQAEILCHNSLSYAEQDAFVKSINNPQDTDCSPCSQTISFKHRFSKEEYTECIDHIREHIKYGDIYEMNFCQEFYVEDCNISPWRTYQKLNNTSPAPFSAFFKEGEHYLISASPERYIQKTDKQIISQPIKGTAKRSKDRLEDSNIKTELKNNLKERAENIMIVDLVRNDLSRIADSSTVKVEELCEIYSFSHVHQMISTISATLEKSTPFTDILKASFPMGSMTGAPKIKAMEIIEKYEKTKRGLFSGSVGYIDPKGNFDFNVIIRSLLYNQKNRYLSLTTGGAITYLSDADAEYQESLLKAKAIFSLFE